MKNKVLRHIIRNGDDRQLMARKWRQTKIELWRMGLLRRRIGDWRWIATSAGRKSIK